jgi:hypothetical protein
MNHEKHEKHETNPQILQMNADSNDGVYATINIRTEDLHNDTGK